MENIYVQFEGMVYQQIVGIPMGTNCAPLIANLFLFCYVRDFMSKQNRSTEGCSKLKRSVDMTSSGKNGLNIRTNASPKWDRTRCPEE